MNSNVIYFSPTGGTKAVAELIINDLNSQVFDMTVSVLPSFFNEDDYIQEGDLFTTTPRPWSSPFTATIPWEMLFWR